MITCRHLCRAALVALLLLFAKDARPAAATATTEPETIVSQSFNNWTVAGGYVYWAQRCYGGELAGPGYLRRQPTSGGSPLTLSTTTADDCQKFLNLGADSAALYHYDLDGVNGYYKRPVGAPGDPATLLYATGNYPVIGSRLVPSGSYLYWVTETAVHRVSTSVGGHQVLATGLSDARDVAIASSTLYWADGRGIWQTATNCTTPPCAATQLATDRANGLLYSATAPFPSIYDLYWVRDADPIDTLPQRIVRRNCRYISFSPLTIECTHSTLYTAPSTNWIVGYLASDGSSLFWTERDALTNQGRLRRMPRDGGPAAVIADNYATIRPELFTDYSYVYFADGGEHGIMRLPLDAAAIKRDFHAAAIEVTQGIQDLSNSTLLVRNKPTYVRAYAELLNGPPAGAVPARLEGSRNGYALPGSPLYPDNGTIALDAAQHYDRANLNDGWLFALPAEWLYGEIDLTLRVDPDFAYDENNLANNTRSGSFTFFNKPPVCVVYVRVRTNSPNYQRINENPNFGNTVNMAEQLWPTPYYRSFLHGTELTKWGLPFALGADGSLLNKMLRSLDDFTDDPDTCDDVGAYTHYVGVIHPDTAMTGYSGLGTIGESSSHVHFPTHTPTTPGPNNNALNWTRAGVTLAHELAHNAGRGHIQCGSDIQPPFDVYPYTGFECQLDDTGGSNNYGFHFDTQTPIAPDAAADLMTYAGTRWTSDFTWYALFNWLGNNRQPLSPAGAALAEANAIVYVSGIYSETAAGPSAALATAWTLPQTTLSSGRLAKLQALSATAHDPAQRTPNTLLLRVRDRSGGQIAAYDVPLTQLDPRPDRYDALFGITFPAPTDPPAGRLELYVGETPLAAHDIDDSVPTVTIDQPTAGSTIDGALRVRWFAQDNAPLRYTALYSPDDGAHWYVVLVEDAGGPYGNSRGDVTLSDPQLPASNGAHGWLLLYASDGYNTGSALAGPFTLLPADPIVLIDSPTDGATYAAGRPVALSGSGMDASSGPLTGSALTWSLDGATVGTGERVALAGVAPGMHTVALAAVGARSTPPLTRTFSVAPLPIAAATAVNLDGHCDDTAYAAVTPINLAPYAGGGQASAHFLYTADDLFVCLSGLRNDGQLSLLLDPQPLGNATPDAADRLLYVNRDGTFGGYIGDPAAGWVAGAVGDYAARVARSGTPWTAELRYTLTELGGSGHMIGVGLLHNSLAVSWPRGLLTSQPATWAAAELGAAPVVGALAPASATAGDSGLGLTVEGSGFVAGAVVLWDGAPLPTTYHSADLLGASVAAARLAQAGTPLVQVQTPGAYPLRSNGLPFTLNNPTPELWLLAPDSATAGQPLTIELTGYALSPDARLIWNGTPLTPRLTRSGSLRVDVPAALTMPAQTLDLFVINPDPDRAHSNALPFTLTAGVPTVAARGAAQAASPPQLALLPTLLALLLSLTLLGWAAHTARPVGTARLNAALRLFAARLP